MQVVPGIYVHHKGGRYRVLGLAHDADDPSRSRVLYVPLYPVDGPVHAVRSVDDFLAEVAPGLPRFRLVRPERTPPPRRIASPQAIRTEDIDAVARAAAALDIVLVTRPYDTLSLCVLDAVFAPNARYDTVRAVVGRYVAWAGLHTSPCVGDGSDSDGEQRLTRFVTDAGALGPDGFADVLGNRQRAWTNRAAPLKAEVALAFAQALVDAGVDRLRDFEALRSDDVALARLDATLAALPGHGAGQRLDRFHALAGDDDRVTVGRHLQTWVAETVGVDVSPAAARARAPGSRHARSLGVVAERCRVAARDASGSRRTGLASWAAVNRGPLTRVRPSTKGGCS